MTSILCDFDGTVTKRDVAGMILKEFASDNWLEMERKYRMGEISSREALSRQFGLVQKNKKELLRFVEEFAKLDPSFMDFVEFCQSKKISLALVSEGLDFYIQYLLKKWNLNLVFYANKAQFKKGRIQIDFPFSDDECDLCGNCKLKFVLSLQEKGEKVIYIGDGYSDVCPSEKADTVFAKGDLLKQCKARRISCIEFRDFGDILEKMRTWQRETS